MRHSVLPTFDLVPFEELAKRTEHAVLTRTDEAPTSNKMLDVVMEYFATPAALHSRAYAGLTFEEFVSNYVGEEDRPYLMRLLGLSDEQMHVRDER